MNITLKEIAKKANVSIGTVSNVINKREKSYSQETEKKILDIIERYRYVPNYAARALNGKCAKTIGLVISSVTDLFFAELLEGIEETCYKEGYNLNLCVSRGDLNKEKDYLNKVIEKDLEGIIFAAESFRVREELMKLSNYGIPVVTIGGEKIVGCGGITVNNFLGTLKATRYMIKEGHTKIAYIGGTEHSVCTKERIDGFRQAMQEAGMEIRGKDFYLGKYDMETGERGMEELKIEDYTAVVVGSDSIAYGVYRFCAKGGIKIPEDLSVVGFDDVFLASKLIPGLTTIRQPIYNTGILATQQIVQAIEEEGMVQEFSTIIPQLIERGSVLKKDAF